ncbi:hypothetical protein [Hyphobacterium sp.]|jgi:hypothetical protein|uniref:hypothetical protein n=1 Tax=Hyphobacterium sp. TaxID=2004662 RepID=UPI003BAA034D
MPASLFASQGSVISMALLVIMLSALNGWATPDKWLAWTGVAFLALAAVMAMVACRNLEPATRRNLYRSLFAAGFSIGIALAFSLGETFNWIPEAASKRTAGVLIGLVLAATGNFLPKAVIPVSARRCHPARAVRAERFVGLVLMMAGIVFAAIWLFAPLEVAKVGSSFAGLVAFGTALAAWMWLHAGTSRAADFRED